ncbi:hypothetical protein L1887_56498 [Cichorium endivia]|nr:hypothetical protein L1887_56498 [Cichorium endivia]
MEDGVEDGEQARKELLVESRYRHAGAAPCEGSGAEIRQGARGLARRLVGAGGKRGTICLLVEFQRVVVIIVVCCVSRRANGRVYVECGGQEGSVGGVEIARRRAQTAKPMRTMNSARWRWWAKLGPAEVPKCVDAEDPFQRALCLPITTPTPSSTHVSPTKYRRLSQSEGRQSKAKQSLGRREAQLEIQGTSEPATHSRRLDDADPPMILAEPESCFCPS